jgi:hypothetical protein
LCYAPEITIYSVKVIVTLTFESKINRGHDLDMAVHPIKLYSCRLINTLVIERKLTSFSFKVIVPLNFDLVNKKSKINLPLKMDNHPTKFKYGGPN